MQLLLVFIWLNKAKIVPRNHLALPEYVKTIIVPGFPVAVIKVYKKSYLVSTGT